MSVYAHLESLGGCYSPIDQNNNGDAPLNMLILSQTFFLNYEKKKKNTNVRPLTSADILGPFYFK